MLMIHDDLIPADLTETVDRLENWASWARERVSQGRAASAEGRFRPERGDLEPKRIPRPFIDVWDAQLVGKCLAPARGFPYRWYVLLKWRYFYRVNRAAICRKMAVNLDNYPSELHRALYAARNTLTKRRTISYDPPVTDATAQACFASPREA